MHAPQWNAEKSVEIYHPDAWGDGYFTFSETGNVVVTTNPNSESGLTIPLCDAVAELEAQGGCLPALIRFPSIIDDRVNYITNAFNDAIETTGYQNIQRTCYPLKTNHRRRVIQNFRSSKVGLEVGTKAELLIAANEIIQSDDLPLLCNGYKDLEYLEAATLLYLSGVNITVTLENTGEVVNLIKCIRRLGSCPKIGLRLRLKTLGKSPWANSSGEDGMFGLTTPHLLSAIKMIQDQGFGDQIEMLHYHVGSQVLNLDSIFQAASEAAKIFCELVSEGLKLKIINTGGGLAVDYGKTNHQDPNIDSFIYKDYTIEGYATAVVSAIKKQCDHFEIPVPVIYCESGRALVAHHSVFVFEVFGTPEIATSPLVPPNQYPNELRSLADAVEADIVDIAELEKLYSGIFAKFQAGLLSVRVKGEADRLLSDARRNAGLAPAPWYFGNLSIFQSLPDMWGIEQVFPVMPIHRLDEYPEVHARISDITCDSDGKFSRFQTGSTETIPLHPLRENERYILGVFNVGAYQETIGDIHNLLARTSAISVYPGKTGEPEFHLDYAGDTIADVLEPVGFCPGEILENIKAHFDLAAMKGRIAQTDANKAIDLIDKIMGSTTYLNLSEDPGPDPLQSE